MKRTSLKNDSPRQSRLSASTGWVYGNRRKAATLAAAAFAAGLGYHVVFGQNGLTAYERKRQDEQQLKQQMSELQRENDRLRDHVARLQTDPSAIEHQARETLHYTRAGEIIYTLPNEAPSTSKVAMPSRQ